MRARTRAGLIGIAAGAAALIAPGAARRAEACSAPQETVDARAVFPGDGSTGVPRNVEVRVRYDGWQVPGPELELRVAGGASVPAQLERVGDVWIVTPAEPLLASTTYELTDTLEVPCAPADASWSSCVVERRAFASFTTGEAIDVAPPTFAGLVSLDSQYVEDPLESCDQPLAAVSIAIAWEPATDDGDPAGLRYNVYAGGTRVAQLDATSASGLAYCGARPAVIPYAPPAFEGPTGSYVVRAVDAAGNEDANEVSFATVACGFPPDAGPDAAPDGGGAGSDGGCAAGGGGRGAAAWLVLAAALAARGRTRRSGRRR